MLPPPITERDLRRKLRPMRRRKSALALALFTADALVYAAAFWGASHMRGAAAWFCGLAEAVAIAMLFIVGHDACHGSLLANRAWNRRLATLAFLPSLPPYTAWELGHNQTHHVYTT